MAIRRQHGKKASRKHRRKKASACLNTRARRKPQPARFRARNLVQRTLSISRNRDTVVPLREAVEDSESSKANATRGADLEEQHSIQSTDALEEFWATKFNSEYVDGFDGSPPERDPPPAPPPQSQQPHKPYFIPLNPALVAISLLANLCLLAQELLQIQSWQALLELHHFYAVGLAGVLVTSTCVACELIGWLRNRWK